MKNIIILGSTGSIGKNTLDIVREHPREFRVVGLVAKANYQTLLSQVKEFRPEVACLVNGEHVSCLKKSAPASCRVLTGLEGMHEAATWKTGEMVMVATSGSSALVPVLDAIRSGKDIALANKEILVMAGRIINEAVKKSGIRFLPVDSEHSAIFQCLQGAKPEDIRRIILTGSGGPLKDTPIETFRGISKEIVIRHPKWKMGKKISVDSATMMNKGLETIEAKWLFQTEIDRIRVIIHPQAVVHSMVEFEDGSIMAQLGPTDMKSPILYALGYPRRVSAPRFGIDLTAMGELTFTDPDTDKFPCLRLAHEAAEHCDSTKPVVLNAADEIAVNAFLRDYIDFTDIPMVIERVLKEHAAKEHPNLNEILQADAWTRQRVLQLCRIETEELEKNEVIR